MSNLNTGSAILQLEKKKRYGLLLADSYARLADKNHDRTFRDKSLLVRDCGTFLEMSEYGEESRITAANFCKDRLCPACAWRRSLKCFGQISSVLDWVESHDSDIKYLFLTLTVRNVRGTDLSCCIDDMSAAFKRLSNNKAWKRRVKGAIKTLEITYNRDADTYHPHYHLILAVSKSYAKKGTDDYWRTEDWAAAWKKSARLPYTPTVHIERVKGRKDAVAETAKYMTKSEDYLIEDSPIDTDRVVEVLSRQLKGKRLISFNGIFGRARKALELEDIESGDLTDKLRDDVATAVYWCHWQVGIGKYREVKKV